MGDKEKIEGKTAKEWFDLAKKAKDPKEEVEYYSKCLELAPNDKVAWFNKGYALNELKRYEEAIECLDKAIEIDRDYACVEQQRIRTW